MLGLHRGGGALDVLQPGQAATDAAEAGNRLISLGPRSIRGHPATARRSRGRRYERASASESSSRAGQSARNERRAGMSEPRRANHLPCRPIREERAESRHERASASES